MELLIIVIANTLAAVFAFIAVSLLIEKIYGLKKVVNERLVERKRCVSEKASLVNVSLEKLIDFPLIIFWPLTLLVLKTIYSRRMRLVEKGVLQAVRMFSNALSAGVSAQEALYILADELEGPIGEEFKLAKEKMCEGESFDETLYSMTQRIDVESFNLFANSVLTLRRLGGNLVEMLNLLTSTIEQNLKIENKMKEATAETRGQARLLSMLPWALLSLLYLVEPDFVRPLLETRLGILILCAIVLFEVVGALWLRKISEVK